MNTLIARYPIDLGRWFVEGWNRFWFTQRDPATLGVIRILAGAMLLYTHAVWSLGLEDFMGAHPWVPRASAEFIHGPETMGWTWSLLWWCDTPAKLWTLHTIALASFFCLTIGFQTRIASVLSFIFCASYANRVIASQFGLDQINMMLALYLMIGPSGAAYSVDRLIARWRAGKPLGLPEPSIMANVAIRLIQIHMCVIYFNAGISKLQGPMWWEGSAIWGAVANLEYQSLDCTWLCNHPYLGNFVTHLTVIWEISFAALVWNRMLRPVVLLVALPLHLGIAFGMGMITFGFVMLYGCMAFVEPWVIRAVLDRWTGKTPSLPQENGGEAEARGSETGERSAGNSVGTSMRSRRPARPESVATSSRGGRGN